MVQSLRILALQAQDHEMKMSLTQNAMYLEMYQKNLVTPMVNTGNDLKVMINVDIKYIFYSIKCY